jgi:hypothetical protein
MQAVLAVPVAFRRAWAIGGVRVLGGDGEARSMRPRAASTTVAAEAVESSAERSGDAVGGSGAAGDWMMMRAGGCKQQ